MQTIHRDHQAKAELAPRFRDAWTALGAASVPEFGVLAGYYQAAHRAYHTLSHLQECIHWLEASRAVATSEAEVALALFYHDAVYDPGASDNEARSASLFAADARRARISGPAMERIAEAIRGTKRHDATDGDDALVRDIDLAILGASPARFAEFEEQVRREFARVDEATYRAGRSRLLLQFLERTAIYATPFFANRLETQARNNLSRSIHRLARKE